MAEVPPLPRSDTLTFEKDIATGTAFLDVARWEAVAPRKLLLHSMFVEGWGDTEIQLIDFDKEKEIDLNMHARKIRFFPLTWPSPIRIETGHEFIVRAMQNSGITQHIKGKIEVQWVK